MATRFCTQCGQPIPENSKFCVNCGAPVPTESMHEPSYAQQQPQQQSQQRYMTKPKSYLALAIISTILCCLPLGIVSIVFAAKVDNSWNAGDFFGAEDFSRKAKRWGIAAVITGLVGGILYFVLMMALGMNFMDLDFLEGLNY